MTEPSSWQYVATPNPTSAPPGHQPVAAAAYPPNGVDPRAVPPAKRDRRPFLIVTAVLGVVVVLIAALVVTALVVINKGDGDAGDSSPTTAVQGFLGGVYANDANAAEKHVCAQALDDEKLTARLATIATATGVYRWDPPAVTSQTQTEATVTTTLYLTTADKRRSSQPITFVTIKDGGWWVCEIRTGP